MKEREEEEEGGEVLHREITCHSMGSLHVTHGRPVYIHQPLHHSQPDACDV